MSEMYNLIKDAYLAYLRSGETINLNIPPHDTIDDFTMVYASDLGRCPLRAALKRRKVAQKFPLTDAEAMSELHIMRQGVKDAEPFQEALIHWGFLHDEHWDVSVEMRVQSEKRGIRGRMDVLMTDNENGVDHIIEIKRRDLPKNGGNKAEPKVTDLLQVLAYKLILEEENPGQDVQAHVVCVNRYYFTVWTLQQLPFNKSYYFEAEDGTQWEPPTPVTEPVLRDEVNRHLSYLYTGTILDPKPDWINSPDFWECGRFVGGKKPKKYKGEYQGAEERRELVERTCPWFCHCSVPGPYEVSETDYESKQYVVHYPEVF